MRRNIYWKNEGGVLVEEALTNGSAAWIAGMGIAVGDLDGDLDLDALMTDLDGMYVLENDGDGTFTGTLGGNGLIGDWVGWGVALIDIDNDGWLDAVNGTDGDELFWLNDGTGQFTPIVDAAAEHLGRTGGLAVGDYDRDGRMDIVFGDHGEGYRLMRNTWVGDNHWLGLQLRAPGREGASPLGARVYLTDSSGHEQVREVHSGSSLGSGHDLGLHFGLGNATPTEIRVVWPDGTEHLLDATIDRWNVVTRAAP